MKIINYVSCRVPTWALYYIEYGEDESLTQDEIDEIKHWETNCKLALEAKEGEEIDFVTRPFQHEYFCYHPDFGLGANVVDAAFILLASDDSEYPAMTLDWEE